MLRAAARAHLAVCRRQRQRLDVGPEGPVAVVVLAVHVGRNQAADGHELRPRNHRRKPSPRHEGPQHVVEPDTGLARQEAGAGIERLHAAQATHRQRELAVERRVAVGPPLSARDQRAVAPQDLGQVSGSVQGCRAAVDDRIPAPSGELHGGVTGSGSSGNAPGPARTRIAAQRPAVTVGDFRAAARAAQAGVLEQQSDRHDEHDARHHPGGQQEQAHLVSIVVPADGGSAPANGSAAASSRS